MAMVGNFEVLSGKYNVVGIYISGNYVGNGLLSCIINSYSDC